MEVSQYLKANSGVQMLIYCRNGYSRPHPQLQLQLQLNVPLKDVRAKIFLW